MGKKEQARNDLEPEAHGRAACVMFDKLTTTRRRWIPPRHHSPRGGDGDAAPERADANEVG